MSVEPVAVDFHVGRDEGWICGRLVATRGASGRWPRRRGVARIRPSGWVLKALCSIRGDSATVCLSRDATRGSFIWLGGARCALMVAWKRQARRRGSRRRWHHSVRGSGIGLAHRSAERLSTRLWRPPSRARRLARKLPPKYHYVKMVEMFTPHRIAILKTTPRTVFTMTLELNCAHTGANSQNPGVPCGKEVSALNPPSGGPAESINKSKNLSIPFVQKFVQPIRCDRARARLRPAAAGFRRREPSV